METMTRDDVTVRMDTDLRAKAKELDIKLGRLLDSAVRAEIERREALAALTAGEFSDIRLDLEDSEGRTYVGKFTGKLLGEARDVFVYLADDERVIVYDAAEPKYHELDDLGDLAGWFPHDPGVYAEIMHALGESPEIDL